jgi:hypothetical protein
MAHEKTEQTDSDFLATVSRLISDAQSDDAETTRSDQMDRYMGEPYGDEVKGRSKFISTDVADAIESILPDILEPFLSAEDDMKFKPIGPEDEEAAKQETAVVHHIFWDKNPGFENLLTFAKEGLIQQNSYIMRGWEEKRRVFIEEYEDLTLDEFADVLESLPVDGDYSQVEVLETSAEGEIGEGFEGKLDVKLRCIKTTKEYVIEAFPQEEFFGTPRWNKVSLHGIPCCGRKRTMERSELLEMGFTAESIDKGTDEIDAIQKSARHTTRDSNEASTDELSTREITVYETFVKADRDGDGINELLKIWATNEGSNILEWEDGGEAISEVSSINISAWTPYMVPHRHIGRSVTELVDDIQHVKTVLFRQTLDNIYQTNNARPLVDESQITANTWADLQNPASNAPIRTRGGTMQFAQVQPIIGTTLPMLDRMDETKEQRVGVTRYNQGLDAESLNKTASGIAQIQAAGQKRNKMIARTLAETGLRDLFLGIHADLRAGPVKELAIKLRGQWVTVNPRTWRDRTDMKVVVGMGSGDDAKRQGFLTQTMQQQQQGLAAGMPGITPQHLHNTYAALGELSGFDSVEQFWTSPEQIPPQPPQPPQPDPALVLAQAQIQNMQTETANNAQIKGQELQLKGMELELKSRELALKEQEQERKDAATAGDIQTDGEKLDLERNKAVMDDDFKRDQMKVDVITDVADRVQAAEQAAPPFPYDEVTQ